MNGVNQVIGQRYNLDGLDEVRLDSENLSGGHRSHSARLQLVAK